MTSILVIIIAAIFIYAVFSMMKKKNNNPQQGEGSRQGGGGKYGKWIGGGLGWAFGGPIGAILGFSLGSLFDHTKVENIYRGTARGDFAMSLLVLAAAVMKADRKVVRTELDYVKAFFLRQFGTSESERLILILREILKQEITVGEVSTQIGQYMDYPSRLQLLHFLFGTASADGQYHPDEVRVIEEISGHMGISSADRGSIRAMFVGNINSAYDILEITPDATNEEVKKAYRRLAVEYHPDKVSHLGEDIRKAATEKIQKLNAAYEEIKKQRGIK
jgi:DnaJ like chaperone protein